MPTYHLDYFTQTGFFEEKALALRLLKDVCSTLSDRGVAYCLMFGTLLGKLRHEDFIPWDDDIDIIIFDIERFESHCINSLEAQGYCVMPDRRLMKNPGPLTGEAALVNCGYRIYHADGLEVPQKKWKFPWVGVWLRSSSGPIFTLPPEAHVYEEFDFFPLQSVIFQGFPVLIPKDSHKILNEYFRTRDWMNFCVAPDLNHREYKKTNAPPSPVSLVKVMQHLRNRGFLKVDLTKI